MCAVTSNCVINLVPDKGKVFAEVGRVLRPGGRLVISDIVLDGPLPEAVASDVFAYVGCVSGAMEREPYFGLLREAGLTEIEVLRDVDYLATVGETDPAWLADLTARTGVGLRATSSAAFARSPIARASRPRPSAAAIPPAAHDEGRAHPRAVRLHRELRAQHPGGGAPEPPRPGAFPARGAPEAIPKGAVHPLALRVLERIGLPTAALRSKSWDEFAGERAPRLDHVVTVCGNAAAEACPRYPGQPATAHWPIDDPAAAEGDEATRLAAFERAFVDIEQRVKGFLAASAGAAQQHVAE